MEKTGRKCSTTPAIFQYRSCNPLSGSEVDFGTRVVKPEVNTIQVHPRVSTFLHRYRRRQSAQADGSTVVSLCRLTRLLLLHGNWQLCDTAPTCARPKSQYGLHEYVSWSQVELYLCFRRRPSLKRRDTPPSELEEAGRTQTGPSVMYNVAVLPTPESTVAGVRHRKGAAALPRKPSSRLAVRQDTAPEAAASMAVASENASAPAATQAPVAAPVPQSPSGARGGKRARPLEPNGRKRKLEEEGAHSGAAPGGTVSDAKGGKDGKKEPDKYCHFCQVCWHTLPAAVVRVCFSPPFVAHPAARHPMGCKSLVGRPGTGAGSLGVGQQPLGLECRGATGLSAQRSGEGSKCGMAACFWPVTGREMALMRARARVRVVFRWLVVNVELCGRGCSGSYACVGLVSYACCTRAVKVVQGFLFLCED